MAKKKKIKLQETEEINDYVPTPTPTVDPLAEKVLDMRGKGYNDNQIASMLMIHKHKIENIK